ncbi:ADP-ribosylglycohydrolase family protein, partial [Streptomyces sp. NPDC055632]
MTITDRAVGAVLGSAVGDALGAPFEFGLPGVFRERFPDGVGELCGGGGWDPGEATDDTQMAVLLGESLLERGGLDLPDVFDRFRRWAAADPKDIGLQTEQVLLGGDPWNLASTLHFQVNMHAAGNGSLMRAATSAVYFAARGRAGAQVAPPPHPPPHPRARAAGEGPAGRPP